MWVLLALTLIGAWVAAGFAIANFTTLNPKAGPLNAGAVSGDAFVTASSALMEGVSSTACADVASCPAGDLDCELCKCSALESPGPCPTFDCACEAILDASGSCVAGADSQKCAICKLGAGQCSA